LPDTSSALTRSVCPPNPIESGVAKLAEHLGKHLRLLLEILVHRYELIRVPRLLPACGPLGQIITSCSGLFTGSSRSIKLIHQRKDRGILRRSPTPADATATRVNRGLRRRVIPQRKPEVKKDSSHGS